MIETLATLIGYAVIGIGIATVTIIAFLGSLYCWNVLFHKLSDFFFDKESVWKMRLSAIFSALAVMKPHKIPAVWNEAPTLVTENDDSDSNSQ